MSETEVGRQYPGAVAARAPDRPAVAVSLPVFSKRSVELGLIGRVVAVVSGGSRGIGRASTRELAREGASVVLAARSAGPLDEAAAALEAEFPGQVEAVSADMTAVDAVERAVAVARDRFGLADIVVGHVIGHVIDSSKEGEGPVAGAFAGMPPEHHREEFDQLLVSA